MSTNSGRGPGLPDGFAVVLRADTEQVDDGRVLLGGSPLTALRLTDRARDLVAGGRLTVTDSGAATLARRLLQANLAHPDLDNLRPAESGELTVVIPVRDRADQLDRTLAGLAPLHCVVVDDASQEPDAIAQVAGRHGASLITLTENLGPAGARNAGLATVTTRLVALVDSDIVVSATDLLALTRHFTDSTVVLVGPRIVGRTRVAGRRPRWFQRYDELASSLDLGPTPATVRPFGQVAWLSSACLVARSAALGPDIGSGFDEHLRVGEDVDLVWRLVDAGHGIRYDPEITAEHDTRGTIRGWLGRKYLYGTSSAPLAARHAGYVAPAVLAPVSAACAAIMLTRTRWSGPAALVALAFGTHQLRKAIPDGSGRTTTSAQVALRGLGWSLRQESALLLRHWWPVTLAGLFSRQVRRAVLTALAVDTILAWRQTRPRTPSDAVIVAVARRLDDLAYGTGVWAGAIQARSFACLIPRKPR